MQIAGVLQDGTGFHYLTAVPNMAPFYTQLSGNGASVAFVSYGPGLPIPTGGCYNGTKIAIVDWDAGTPTALDDGAVPEPTIDDAASVVVLAHDGDPLGTNGYRDLEIFAVDADGANLRQLSPDVEGVFDPADAPDLAGNDSSSSFARARTCSERAE